ncbi:hypothetical protein K466DRAFT_350039 [Polyporus arcularius HHB13444]|uniref:Uncharacterized protein n=1 Tax=Polyporus arcularius HHB13444 TaxID=1314778 RepID=A0A5C3P5Q8_9APHY|nr:hypothetical protein K466DRAFT_350039 [Polyporus arcularius HHB13444]
MQPQQIDDDDPRVQYSPGWSQDDSPGSFDSSLHGSATPGSTATLTFTGTSVEVHGIVMNTRQHPTMTFTVDGGSTSTYPAPTVGNKNNMLFFSASGLSSDQHRLVITNQDGGGPIALWLDFFIVTPPQGPPPGHTHSDPPTSPNSSNTPRSTSTSTSTSQVNPAPTISPADPPSTPSDTSSAPNANSTQSLPVSTSSESSSGSDSDSGSSTASGSQSTTASSKPSSSTSSPRSGSPTSYRSLPDNASSTTPGAFASSTSTLGGDPVTPAVTDTAHAASRPNVGAIVGGVIGALVVLLLLILALFLYRRRLTSWTSRS